MYAPPGSLPTDPMWARFETGSEVPIPDSTCAGFKAQSTAGSDRRRKSGKMVGSKRFHFNAQHHEDGKDVTVMCRNDTPAGRPKARLVCLRHEGRPQVAMVNVLLFKNDVDMTEPALEAKAIAWMCEKAKLYVSGEMTKEQILDEKKKLITKQKPDIEAEEAPTENESSRQKPKSKAKGKAKGKVACKKPAASDGRQVARGSGENTHTDDDSNHDNVFRPEATPAATATDAECTRRRSRT